MNNTPASRGVYARRIYDPLLYGGIVSYRKLFCKLLLDLTSAYFLQFSRL